MTLLLGLGISTTGALVVFGALTGRLAAMLAAVVKPSDLAGAASGGPDIGLQSPTEAGADSILLTALVTQVRTFGASNDPQWKATVEPLVVKATSTRKTSDYDAAIAALRQLLAQYKQRADSGNTLQHGGP